MMHNYYGGWGMMGGGWLFQLLVLILFFVVVWWALQANQRFGYRSEDSAMEILKKRRARGEIDKKEFESLKEELED